MSNEREDVSIGQMTRQERFGNRGLDWQRETDQSQDRYITDKAAEISKATGVPVETILILNEAE